VQEAIGSYNLDDVPGTLEALGPTLRRELGGSLGPLYGVFFLCCGSALEGSGTKGLAQWAEALNQGCRAISELGGGAPGIGPSDDSGCTYQRHRIVLTSTSELTFGDN